MKTLFVNSHHRLGGGDRTYMFNLADLLRRNGHEVAFFAMKDHLNISSEWSKYFVEKINFRDIYKEKAFLKSLKAGIQSIYSTEAKQKIKAVIRDFRPDIAHLQTIHTYLTPSVIHAIHGKNIPIVWTLHIGTPICQIGTFYINNTVCEACIPKKYYKAVINKCTYGSVVASSIKALSTYLYHGIGIYKLVDKYISPSNFLKSQFVKGGFPSEKITTISNFINTNKSPQSYGNQGYGLFVGRLVGEKGVSAILNSLHLTKNLPFKIVGDGNQRGELESLSRNLRLENVEFLGYQSGENLNNLYRKAAFIVVPSESYENMPYSILEAFSHGKPVIATRIGGIPELIDDGKNGFLCDVGNYNDLANKMIKLVSDPEFAAQMGMNGRFKVENNYNEKIHYQQIIQVYRELIK